MRRYSLLALFMAVVMLVGCGAPEVKVYEEWPFGEKAAKRRQRETAEALGVPVEKEIQLGDGLSMKMVLIPAGEFMMGSKLSPDEVADRYGGKAKYFTDEHPRHSVSITEPFYMGVTEVTHEQYEAVMGEKPSHFDGKQNPAELVTWNDATEFCKKLSQKTGETIRLPTEAQWEYACRAGSTSAYCFGESERQLGDYAWYDDNSDGKTHPVAQKKPNDWGLYDMHGNVWEWCRDWYDGDYYENNTITNPTGPTSGSYRVVRGGSWANYAYYVRSANRDCSDPSFTYLGFGFRVVLRVSSPE